jgi:hypothetical protein
MKGKMDADERLAKAEAIPAPPVKIVAAQPPPQKPAFLATTPAPSPKAEPHSPALRYAGYAAFGVGALAGGAAFALHNSAQSSADQFNSKYQAGTLTSSDAKLRDDAQSKGKLATGAVVAGAALLVSGAVLTFAF